MKIIEHDITNRGWFNCADLKGWDVDFGTRDRSHSTFTAIVKVIGKIGPTYRGGPRPGDTLYYVKGELHREDGPAEIRPGWLVNYFLHNERLALTEYWERQKDTIHAPKIMAYVLGQNE